MKDLTRRSLFGVLVGAPVAGALSVTGEVAQAEAVHVIKVHNESSASNFRIEDAGWRLDEAGDLIHSFILHPPKMVDPIRPIEAALRRACRAG